MVQEENGDPLQHPSYPVQWYFVCGAVLGTLVSLVGLTACAYKCYQKRINSQSNRLAAAVKKGLKEDRKVSINYHVTPVRPDLPIPEKKGTRSPGSRSPVEKSECRIVDETSPKASPTEKRDDMKEDGKKGLGELHFTVDYDKQKTALIVGIIQASGLPPKNLNIISSDPYIKLQLLPEKRHRVKTRVMRKTLNPTFDEIFTFYGVTMKQLDLVSLHFVVLSFDRYSRDDVIGEVIFPLAGAGVAEQQVELWKDISPRHIKAQSHGRGELLVSLCYQPAANRLTVVILKARNLPKIDVTGLSDPYVKVYLLYNGQRIAKKKTHVKKCTLNPVFNESFLFDVPTEGLANLSLELMLLDWDRMAKSEMIGRVEIGAKNGEQEMRHWNEVINCPRKQIAEWHKLKE